MIEVKTIKIQSIGIVMCLLVFMLASVVTAQEAQPYQYTPPNYRNSYNYERRGYTSYSGFRAPSLSPYHGETVKFPDDTLSPMSPVHGYNDQNQFIERHKKDMHRSDEANEVSGLMKHRMFFYRFIYNLFSLSI